MKLSHVAAAVVVILLASLGGVVYVLGGAGGVGGPGTLDDVTVSEVRLNDDLSGDLEGTESGSATCAGPPPDHYVVRFRARIDDDESGRYTSTDSYELTVRIGDESTTREVRVANGGTERVEDLAVVTDDDSVDPGGEVSVTVTLDHDGRTVGAATRTATATPQDMNCENADG